MPACKIDSSHPSFRNAVKAAQKRHNSFLKELDSIVERIKHDPFSVGDRVQCGDRHVRKVRIGCPKEKVAPRAGYRLIFWIRQDEKQITALLLDCYYKSYQSNIDPSEIKRLVKLAPNQ